MIVITGSESFVGKELISQCKQNSIDFVGLDLINKKESDYVYYQIDIKSPKIINYIPENADAVIHLAAMSRDADCKGRAYECFDNNVMGTLNMIKACKEKNVKQFIFASSEWVYDEFIGNEEKDEDSLINAHNYRSEYAFSKLVTEINLKQQYELGFCSVTILRFGIIYGPRKNNWSAVESIASTIKNKNEITVGSLENARRFIHVSDIASGIIKSIGLHGFNIINLTGNNLLTTRNLIDECEKIYGKKMIVVERDHLTVSIRNPSNQRAKQIINWEPKISIGDGIRTLDKFL
jgi:UDP-glucose 4-epimerase